MNGRIGIEGPDDRWGIELWAQNLFDKTYKQVAFDAPTRARPERHARGPGRLLHLGRRRFTARSLASRELSA